MQLVIYLNRLKSNLFKRQLQLGFLFLWKTISSLPFLVKLKIFETVIFGYVEYSVLYVIYKRSTIPLCKESEHCLMQTWVIIVHMNLEKKQFISSSKLTIIIENFIIQLWHGRYNQIIKFSLLLSEMYYVIKIS